jgi:methionyl-tRNA formyltransferase
MRIVLFTRVGFQSDELFVYMFSRVVQRFPDAHVVAVAPQETTMRAFASLLSKYWRKMRRLGLLNTVEILTSYPLQVLLASQDQKNARRLLRQLPRPAMPLDGDRVVYVRTVNGADAIQAMTALEPDVIVQAGAGILRPGLFKTARLGTVNLHHGIAPLIRGMSSIYWALWEKRPDWLGATIHWIDEGIDTGEVLAYAPIAPVAPGEGYPALFAQATQKGVDQLVKTLTRLEAGEQWVVPPAASTSVHRSTISGWKLLILRLRPILQRAPRS